MTISDFRDLVRIVEDHPEWRSELRRLLLTEELLSLPQLIRELAEAQRRTEEELRNLARRVDDLAQQMGTLVNWQKGEAGRREGERYERTTVKRGLVLFGGGHGGATDDPRVQVRLSRWLRPILEDGRSLEADEDPTLADVIWWKGDRVAVVEVSLKVNGRDVERAWKRAKVLESVGVEAFGVVIGQDWDSLEARALAKERGVEWMVAGSPSEGFLAFRRLRC